MQDTMSSNPLDYQTTDDLRKRFGKHCNNLLDKLSSKGIDVNCVQLFKFLQIVEFYKEVVVKCNGVRDTLKIDKDELCGNIAASFAVFDVDGDTLAQFCSVMRYANEFSIFVNPEGEVCIGCTVYGVIKGGDDFSDIESVGVVKRKPIIDTLDEIIQTGNLEVQQTAKLVKQALIERKIREDDGWLGEFFELLEFFQCRIVQWDGTLKEMSIGQDNKSGIISVYFNDFDLIAYDVVGFFDLLKYAKGFFIQPTADMEILIECRL